MTPTVDVDPARLKAIYETDAARYCRSLPLEHFMESIPQSTQRKITLAAFDLIHAARPDVHCFSELLVQYPVAGEPVVRPARVVPDNMVVVHPAPLDVDGSYMLPLQPVGPFLVIEYVSKSNARKDYEDNMTRYERDLEVPYYLLFYPDGDELSVFRLADGRYASVRPDAAGRLAIPELELEAALLDGWVRYWFRGELLPLTAELRGQLAAEQAARAVAERAADAERQRAEAESARADAERQRAEAESARADAERQRAEAERQRAEAGEAELARLRAELAALRPGV